MTSVFSGTSSSAPWKRVGKKYFGDLFGSTSRGYSKEKRKELKLLLESCIEYIESNSGQFLDEDEMSVVSAVSGVSALTSSMVRVSGSSLFSVLLTLLKPLGDERKEEETDADSADFGKSGKGKKALDESAKMTLTLLHSLLRHSLSSISRRLLKHEWVAVMQLLTCIMATARKKDGRVVFECVECLALLFDRFLLSATSVFATDMCVAAATVSAIEALIATAIADSELLPLLASMDPTKNTEFVQSAKWEQKARAKSAQIIGRLAHAVCHSPLSASSLDSPSTRYRVSSDKDLIQAAASRRAAVKRAVVSAVSRHLKRLLKGDDEFETESESGTSSKKRKKKRRAAAKKRAATLSSKSSLGSVISRVCRLLSSIVDSNVTGNSTQRGIDPLATQHSDDATSNTVPLLSLKDLSKLTESLLQCLEFRMETVGATPASSTPATRRATDESVASDASAILAFCTVMISSVLKRDATNGSVVSDEEDEGVEQLTKFVLSFHSLVTGSLRPLVARFGSERNEMHVSLLACLCTCLKVVVCRLAHDAEDALDKLVPIVQSALIDTLYDTSASVSAVRSELVIRQCNDVFADLMLALVSNEAVVDLLCDPKNDGSDTDNDTAAVHHGDDGDDAMAGDKSFAEDCKGEHTEEEVATSFMNDDIASLGFGFGDDAANGGDFDVRYGEGSDDGSDEDDDEESDSDELSKVLGDDSDEGNGLVRALQLVGGLLHYRYRSKWTLVFDLWAKLFRVFGESIYLSPDLSIAEMTPGVDSVSKVISAAQKRRLQVLFELVQPMFVQLCELRDANSGDKSPQSILSPLMLSFLDDCLGNALRFFGPQLALDAFPLFGGGKYTPLELAALMGAKKCRDKTLVKTVASFYQRHWLFYICQKWCLYHCTLDYFGRCMLPMADALFKMGAAYEKKHSMLASAMAESKQSEHVKALSDLAHCIWRLLPVFMKAPTDVVSAFSDDESKIAEGMAKYLSSMPPVRKYITQGLTTLLSNLRVMSEYKERQLLDEASLVSGGGKSDDQRNNGRMCDLITVSARSGGTHTAGFGRQKMRVVDSLYFKQLSTEHLAAMRRAVAQRSADFLPILLNLCVATAESQRHYTLRLIALFAQLCSAEEGTTQYTDDLMKRTLVKYLQNDAKLANDGDADAGSGKAPKPKAVLKEQSAFLVITEGLIDHVSDDVLVPFWTFLKQQLSATATPARMGDCRLLKLLFANVSKLISRLLLSKSEVQASADARSGEFEEETKVTDDRVATALSALKDVTDFVSSMDSLTRSKGAAAIVERSGRLLCISALLTNAAEAASAMSHSAEAPSTDSFGPGLGVDDEMGAHFAEDSEERGGGHESDALKVFVEMVNRFTPELVQSADGKFAANVRTQALVIVTEIGSRLEDLSPRKFESYVGEIVAKAADNDVAAILCSAHLLSHLTDLRMPLAHISSLVALLASPTPNSIVRTANKDVFKASLRLLKAVVSHAPDSALKCGDCLANIVSALCGCIADKRKQKQRALMSRIVDKLLTRFGFELVSTLVQRESAAKSSKRKKKNMSQTEAMKLVKYLRKRGVYLENRKKAAASRQRAAGRKQSQRHSKLAAAKGLGAVNADDSDSESSSDFGAHSEFEKLTMKSAMTSKSAGRSSVRMRVDAVDGGDVLDLSSPKRVSANLVALDVAKCGASQSASKKKPSLKDYGISVIETRDGREKMLIRTDAIDTSARVEAEGFNEEEEDAKSAFGWASSSGQSPAKRRRFAEKSKSEAKKNDVWAPGELQPYSFHMVSPALMHPKKKHLRKRAFGTIMGKSRKSDLRAKSNLDSLKVSTRGRVERGSRTLKKSQIRARAKHGGGVLRARSLSRKRMGELRKAKKRKASELS